MFAVFHQLIGGFPRFLRPDTDNRIGFLFDAFPLRHHLLLVMVAPVNSLFVPLPHTHEAVLRRVAVDDRHIQIFHVMKITGEQNRESRFSNAAFLVAECNK